MRRLIIVTLLLLPVLARAQPASQQDIDSAEATVTRTVISMGNLIVSLQMQLSQATKVIAGEPDRTKQAVAAAVAHAAQCPIVTTP
jgi:hypothetical protein